MHTKGPWSWIIHDYSGASLTGVDTLKDIVLTVGPCKSCMERKQEWEWGRCSTPNQDDACLIAAAPELLEACELTFAIVIDGYDAGDEPLNKAWDAAREAIRKAKGE